MTQEFRELQAYVKELEDKLHEARLAANTLWGLLPTCDIYDCDEDALFRSWTSHRCEQHRKPFGDDPIYSDATLAVIQSIKNW